MVKGTREKKMNLVLSLSFVSFFRRTRNLLKIVLGIEIKTLFSLSLSTVKQVYVLDVIIFFIPKQYIIIQGQYE